LQPRRQQFSSRATLHSSSEPHRTRRARRKCHGNLPSVFSAISAHSAVSSGESASLVFLRGLAVYNGSASTARPRGDLRDAPKRGMSELPPKDRGLARGVVCNRSAIALPRASGHGLPIMSPARGISKGKDRTGAARSSVGKTPRGQSGRMGCFSGSRRWRNAPGLHVDAWSRNSIRRLLDNTGNQAG
jgi:hypothetical protein